MMSRITRELLHGTWRYVRTEVPPPFDVREEFLHWGLEGYCVWLFPFRQHPVWRARFTFRITSSGAVLEAGNGKTAGEILLRMEDQLLVLTGTHGYTSWLEKMSPGEWLEIAGEWALRAIDPDPAVNPGRSPVAGKEPKRS